MLPKIRKAAYLSALMKTENKQIEKLQDERLVLDLQIEQLHKTNSKKLTLMLFGIGGVQHNYKKMNINENKRFSFSGHESFQCRSLWLKKGYDYVKKGKSFNDEDAVVELGVGKNMVGSIRYWMKAFDMLDTEDKLTPLADKLLADDGWDPYLEDEASLWLLHYHLVTKGYATTYILLFNELRKEKIEFTKEAFLAFINRKAEIQKITVSKNTINADFDVMIKLYNRTNSQSNDKEDNFMGILSELEIMRNFSRNKLENYVIENNEKPQIPYHLILYGILKSTEKSLSVSFSEIDHDYNSVGNVFAINRSGLMDKIESFIEDSNYKGEIIFNDQAGIKELQFRSRPEPISILEHYYSSVYAG